MGVSRRNILGMGRTRALGDCRVMSRMTKPQDQGPTVVRYRHFQSCFAACQTHREAKGFPAGTIDRASRYASKLKCWGWCEDKRAIHLWVSCRAKLQDVIALVAHEIGHTIRPHHKYFVPEETKACKYSRVARMATEIASDLGYISPCQTIV